MAATMVVGALTKRCDQNGHYNINNEYIFDTILRNIKSLTNFVDNIIEQTDEDVVNIGAINLNRTRNK